MNRLRLGAAPLALLLMLTSCTSSTPFGEVVSVEEELALGKEEAPLFVEARGGLYRNQKLLRYLNGITDKLTATVDVPEGYPELKVQVLNTSEPGAFAVQGGQIFLTRGMVAFAEDEAQVAGAIAHEIGHVIARHSAKRLATQQRLVRKIISDRDQELIRSSRARRIAIVEQELEARLSEVTSYSREQELEADKLAVQMMIDAGYAPSRFGSLLQRIGRDQALINARTRISASKLEELGQRSGHPKIPDRIAALGTFPSVPVDREARERLMDQIDGLFYDDRYQGGILRNGTFWNPSFQFAFDIPSELEPTQNKGLGLMSAHGIILVQFEWGNDVGIDDLVERIQEKGDIYEAPRRTSVAGFPAVIARSELKRGALKLTREFTAIKLEKGFAFFAVVTKPEDEENMRPIFSKILESARSEKNGRYARLYYRTRKVKSGETVESLVKESKFRDAGEEEFRLYNDLDATSEPDIDDWIKLVK